MTKCIREESQDLLSEKVNLLEQWRDYHWSKYIHYKSHYNFNIAAQEATISHTYESAIQILLSKLPCTPDTENTKFYTYNEYPTTS